MFKQPVHVPNAFIMIDRLHRVVISTCNFQAYLCIKKHSLLADITICNMFNAF